MKWCCVILLSAAVAGCTVVPSPGPMPAPGPLPVQPVPVPVPVPNPVPTPVPVPSTTWQSISHDATVASARNRASIYRDAATRQWSSETELAGWLTQQLQAKGDPYQPIKAALAAEFQAHWDVERQRAIMLELAKGYELVQ